jgi:hypothetical protein
VIHPEAAVRRQTQFAEYVVLDAIIGNTDRHHENWGVLRRHLGTRWVSRLAPTFDHASSLGRELVDFGTHKSRDSILTDGRIARYSAAGGGGIYWSSTDRSGMNPVQLLKLGAERWPGSFAMGPSKARQLNRDRIECIVNRIPVDWVA